MRRRSDLELAASATQSVYFVSFRSIEIRTPSGSLHLSQPWQEVVLPPSSLLLTILVVCNLVSDSQYKKRDPSDQWRPLIAGFGHSGGIQSAATLGVVVYSKSMHNRVAE